MQRSCLEQQLLLCKLLFVLCDDWGLFWSYAWRTRSAQIYWKTLKDKAITPLISDKLNEWLLKGSRAAELVLVSSEYASRQTSHARMFGMKAPWEDAFSSDRVGVYKPFLAFCISVLNSSFIPTWRRQMVFCGKKGFVKLFRVPVMTFSLSFYWLHCNIFKNISAAGHSMCLADGQLE